MCLPPLLLSGGHFISWYLGGIVLGSVGTLVGIGGGFLLVPVLSMLEPTWPAARITAFSLAVVAANALSGTASYLRQRRVDIRSVFLFSLAALPGSVIGVFLGGRLSHGLFIRLFAILLGALAVWILLAGGRTKTATGSAAGQTHRRLTDADGVTLAWSFDSRIALLGSVVIGITSSLFGIGGGLVTVPFLVSALHFPTHFATATSHGILAITALFAVAVHLTQGDYARDAPLVLATAAGALCGAPIGAAASRRMPGAVLMRILAGLLLLLAIRLFFWST